MLKRSDAHVYLSYPFVASWSLREAMACGCAIIGWDTPTVTEFIRHRETGIVVPALDHNAIATAVPQMLESPYEAARMRQAARAYAETRLGMRCYIERYRALIERVSGKKSSDSVVFRSLGQRPIRRQAITGANPVVQGAVDGGRMQAG